MKHRTLTIAVKERLAAYEITIGSDLLSGCGGWAQKSLGRATQKICLVSNPTVHKLYGRQVEESLASAGFDTATFLIGDGERYKSIRSAESALRFFSENS